MKGTGIVVKGQGIASKVFGVPTANLEIDQPLAIQPGSYAVWVGLGSAKLPGLLYVSMKPVPKYEVHILNFTRDLYGQTLGFAVLHKLSEPVPFLNLDQMRQKIVADVWSARQYFLTQSSSVS